MRKRNYDTVLSIHPNATDIIGNKGVVLVKLGYYTDAIKIFDKILSIDPNSVIGLYNKGTCLDKLGQHIQANELHNNTIMMQIIKIELNL